MTEIFIQIYNSADRAICSIPDGWPYKILMGILLIAMSKHIMLFTAFAVLVALDLFAKFIALSYHWLIENNVEKPSLVDSIRGIPAAHRARIINSHEYPCGPCQFCTDRDFLPGIHRASQHRGEPGRCWCVYGP